MSSPAWDAAQAGASVCSGFVNEQYSSLLSAIAGNFPVLQAETRLCDRVSLRSHLVVLRVNNFVRLFVLVSIVVYCVAFEGLLCLPKYCVSVVHFKTETRAEYLLSVRKMCSVLKTLMG